MKATPREHFAGVAQEERLAPGQEVAGSFPAPRSTLPTYAEYRAQRAAEHRRKQRADAWREAAQDFLLFTVATLLVSAAAIGFLLWWAR